MCLVEYFHPQDLLALGLALGGLACAMRGKWSWAGVLLGLALVSQQYALLVFAPLLVLVPRKQLVRFVGSAMISGAIIAVPLIVLTNGRAFTSVVVGTGESSTSSSLLVQTGVHGSLLYVLSRFLPIALAIALAWWAHQRLGRFVLDPIPLASLISTSLSFRLIFEVNVWGYYFMAVAVFLVVLDVVRGRVRTALVIWLALVTWAAIHVFVNHPSHQPIPVWFWQAVLVCIATTLAIRPLLSEMKNHHIGAPEDAFASRESWSSTHEAVDESNGS
jgi:uncharacterized membrane protein